mmetsp:Transcript_48090/g.127430  ORF Transcript_48090/g.127430 Transcript_48090/m.127430 type:complete len:308 (-) Transcript_48090:1220-2143(-)
MQLPQKRSQNASTSPRASKYLLCAPVLSSSTPLPLAASNPGTDPVGRRGAPKCLSQSHAGLGAQQLTTPLQLPDGDLCANPRPCPETQRLRNSLPAKPARLIHAALALISSAPGFHLTLRHRAEWTCIASHVPCSWSSKPAQTRTLLVPRLHLANRTHESRRCTGSERVQSSPRNSSHSTPHDPGKILSPCPFHPTSRLPAHCAWPSDRRSHSSFSLPPCLASCRIPQTYSSIDLGAGVAHQVPAFAAREPEPEWLTHRPPLWQGLCQPPRNPQVRTCKLLDEARRAGRPQHNTAGTSAPATSGQHQ